MTSSPVEVPDLEALRTAFRDFVPHNRALDMELVSATFEPPVAVLRLPWAQRLVGNPDTGALHGGVITTLLDATGGAAVYLRLKEPVPIATLDLRIDYLGPGEPGQAVHARAECFHRTRNVAFVRAVAFHEDPSRPIASAAATFMISTPGKSVVATERASR